MTLPLKMLDFNMGFNNSWFAHDVISCHWAPSWLSLQITSAVCSEVLVSIYYLIVSFSVL